MGRNLNKTYLKLDASISVKSFKNSNTSNKDSFLDDKPSENQSNKNLMDVLADSMSTISKSTENVPTFKTAGPDDVSIATAIGANHIEPSTALIQENSQGNESTMFSINLSFPDQPSDHN